MVAEYRRLSFATTLSKNSTCPARRDADRGIGAGAGHARAALGTRRTGEFGDGVVVDNWMGTTAMPASNTTAELFSWAPRTRDPERHGNEGPGRRRPGPSFPTHHQQMGDAGGSTHSLTEAYLL